MMLNKFLGKLKRFYLPTPPFHPFGFTEPRSAIGICWGEMSWPLLHPQNRMQKGKHHLHVRLQQLWKQNHAGFFSKRCRSQAGFPRVPGCSFQVTLMNWTRGKPKTKHKKPNQKHLLVFLTEIKFNKRKTVLGLKEGYNFISVFAHL